jgi:hypothetical protein
MFHVKHFVGVILYLQQCKAWTTGRFSFSSLKNKFLKAGLGEALFWGFFAVVYLLGGTPSTTRDIGIMSLGGISFQSIERN